MAYETHGSPTSRRRRQGATWEYRTYFVAIFVLIALPGAILRWTFGVFRPSSASSHRGVVQEALSEAHIVTTMIFSA